MELSGPQRRLQNLANQLLPVTPVSRSTPEISLSSCSGSNTSLSSLLEGKTAIITGAGKGIGEATAKLLAAHGAAIVVCDVDAAAAKQVAEAITAAGGRAVAVDADIMAEGAPARIVDAAISAFGSLHIIVNNAGFTWDGVIQKITAQQWDVMLAVHVTAPFRIIQAATPHMRDKAKQEMASGGKAADRVIINISSTSGTHGNAGQTNYAAAKAAVCGLTKSIAKEWGPFNIRCNAIAYGLIATRLTQAKEGGESIQVGGTKVSLGIPGANKHFDAMRSSIPLQRMGTAEEAAGAVLMLVSPWASYITGQVLEVSGGTNM